MIMRFRGSLAALGIAALCVSPVIAAEVQTPSVPTAPATKPILQDAEKEKDIRQFLTLTGSDKMGKQVMEQMLPKMQEMLPQVPQAFWQRFHKKTMTVDLTDRLLPIYDKYYSKEDVKGLVQFYQTPLGQKVIATTPSIVRESQMMGSAWGQEVAQEIIREIQEKDAAKPATTKAKPEKSTNKPPAAPPKKAASR